MKNLFILILCAVLTALQAQPTLTRSNCSLNINDSYDVMSSDPMALITNISPETAGENVSWDFSSMNQTFTSGVTSICVAPSTTVFADSVSNATLCIKSEGTDDGAYQYLNITDSKMEITDIGSYQSGNASFGDYIPPQKAFDFPLSYGTTFNQTYVVRITSHDGSTMLDSSEVSTVVDGWGTLITPTGTYDNTLRIKRTSVSSTYFYMGDSWMAGGGLTITDYEWYQPGIPRSVMNVAHFEGDDGYSAVYLSSYTHNSLEDKSLPNSSLQLFPNPCKDELNISAEGQNIQEVNIYSASGQLIHSMKNPDERITISTLRPGIYFLKLQTNGGVITKQFLKE